MPWSCPICKSWHEEAAVVICPTKFNALHLQNKELLEALQNMTGLFGEAATRLKMGKAFTDLHMEAVKIAKEALAKYVRNEI